MNETRSSLASKKVGRINSQSTISQKDKAVINMADQLLLDNSVSGIGNRELFVSEIVFFAGKKE